MSFFQMAHSDLRPSRDSHSDDGHVLVQALVDITGETVQSVSATGPRQELASTTRGMSATVPGNGRGERNRPAAGAG